MYSIPIACPLCSPFLVHWESRLAQRLVSFAPEFSNEVEMIFVRHRSALNPPTGVKRNLAGASLKFNRSSVG